MKLTYIYLKTCSCGLKYFGKTTQDNYDKYKGSGIRWKAHLNKHVKHIVKTKLLKSFINENECEKYCLKFSKDNDIVNNKLFANLIIENGLDGGDTMSEEMKRQMSINNSGVNNPFYGQKHSEKTRLKISKANKGKIITKEQREKISKSLKGKKWKQNNFTCYFCNKSGGISNMKRYHSNAICLFK
jgi:hypothetical protein